STGRMAGDDMAWLDDMVRRAASELRAAGDVRVRVIADAEMAEAHERWSGVAGTTDVLTFDLRDAASDPLDVDALVCLDEAERRGAEREHEPRAELLLYALHAILHCMGHDDHTDTAYAAMHAREDEVLEAIGVGPLFESRQVDTRPFDQRGGAS
ncbi:MAG: rRNA maturation RNase YbeY, partial [Planctomycetota bacterium]